MLLRFCVQDVCGGSIDYEERTDGGVFIPATQSTRCGVVVFGTLHLSVSTQDGDKSQLWSVHGYHVMVVMVVVQMLLLSWARRSCCMWLVGFWPLVNQDPAEKTLI